MKARVTIILAAVTAVAVMAAAAVLIRDHRAGAPETRLALYPAVEKQMDAVTRMVIADKAGTLTLSRAASGAWVVAEKGDYPANAEKAQRLLRAFPSLRVIEAKTRRADLYDRLGVSDLGADKSRALRITLLTADGKTVAALLVGDRARAATPGGQSASTDRAYVRKDGEAQSWLVEGLPELAATPAFWLDDRLFAVDRDRVQAVTIRHKDGEVLSFSRAAASDPDFRIKDMPRGRVVSAAAGPMTVAAALSFLAFDDVRPAARAGQPDAVAEFMTFDGLTVTASLRGDWVHFEAAAGQAAATAEARAITTRLAGWDYKIPAYKIKELAPQLEDMLEPRGSAPH